MVSKLPLDLDVLLVPVDVRAINASRAGTITTYEGMQRPILVSYPDGGSIVYCYGTSDCYSGSLVPQVNATTVAIDSSSSAQSATTLDGLGRKIIDQLPNGAYVGYGYTALGNLCAQSNPTTTSMPSAGLSCSASANAYLITAATDGITYFGYDALGRSLSVTHQDNSSQSWQYSGATTTFTDEKLNQWSRTSDALGRLVKVLEPNGSIHFCPN